MAIRNATQVPPMWQRFHPLPHIPGNIPNIPMMDVQPVEITPVIPQNVMPNAMTAPPIFAFPEGQQPRMPQSQMGQALVNWVRQIWAILPPPMRQQIYDYWRAQLTAMQQRFPENQALQNVTLPPLAQPTTGADAWRNYMQTLWGSYNARQYR